MNPAWILIGFVFGLMTGYLLVSRRHRSKYLAFAEYWVYLPGEALPPQEAVLSRIVRDNPYKVGAKSPIGPAEGILFSDVRLHIALVLRSKNPHAFHPDQFDDHILPSPELLEALNSASSFVKLRYVSDRQLSDKRHLQFLLHAADAYAELGNGQVIFDAKAENVMSRVELQDQLRANLDVTQASIHTQVIWKPGIRSSVVETRGLIKVGLSELRTYELENDQRVIATTVMTEVVKSIWDTGSIPPTLNVAAFGDTFKVQFEKMKDKAMQVRILRVQEI